jgi:hypothetical protein
MKYRLYRTWFILLLVTGMTGMLHSQNTVSPYSIFGPGEIQPRGFGQSIGMGRAGIAIQSGIRLNNLNPASYTGIDSLHFIFELGIDGKLSGMESGGNHSSKLNANMQYLAMGFPIARWWSNSLGISPFSSVGYSITTQNFIEGSDTKYLARYTGSGGLTLAYWANAFRITRNLSVGINTSFIFGPLTKDEYIYQPDLNAAYTITENHYMHSFCFDYGLQYMFRIKNLNFGAGLTYANRQSLVSGYNRTVQDANLSTIDNKVGKKGKNDIPETAGIGLMASKPESFTLAVDYQIQKWEGIKYPVMPGAFRNAHSFSAGIEFKPWKMSVSNRFYQNWYYRAGGNYTSSYLNFGNRTINKAGVSFGLGIPLPGRISMMNIAFEAGTQGTSTRGLVRETYLLGHLNFSLNEFWFVKNKYY